MKAAADGSVAQFSDIEESDDSLKSQELDSALEQLKHADSADENGLVDIEVKQPPTYSK